MIPLHLQIKGFLSYYEQVDLDFTSFDLACISGSNGAGKSSLLDAITWALFKQARGHSDDQIINHFSNSAEVILDFDYENLRYRVQRSKQKGKTGTLDFFVQNEDGKWKTLTEATQTATQERIQQTLRLDYLTFTNASFFLQGKADQFTQQQPGERKKILTSILGLEIWELFKIEAARRKREHEIRLAEINGVLADFDEELKETEQRNERLKFITHEYTTKQQLLDTQKALMDHQRIITERYNSEQKTLEKQSAEIKRLKEALDKKQEDLRVRQEERNKFQERVKDENHIRAEHDTWLKNRSALEEQEQLAVRFRDLETQKQQPFLVIEKERASLTTEIKSLTTRQKEVEELQKGLSGLGKQIEELESCIVKNTKEIEKRSTLENEKSDISAEKTRLKVEEATLRTDIADLIERRKELSKDSSALCPTCAKPLSFEERQRLLEDIENVGKAKKQLVIDCENKNRQLDLLLQEKEISLLALKKTEAELLSQQRLHDVKNEQLHKSQIEIETWMSNGFKRLEIVKNLLANESFSKEARQTINAIDAEIKLLGYDAVQHEKARALESAGREWQQHLLELEQAKAALQPLEREIVDLEKSIEKEEAHLSMQKKDFESGQQRLAEISPDIPDQEKTERVYYELVKEVNNLLTEKGRAQSEVDVLKSILEQKASKLEEKEGVNKQIANCKILEKAFGKDGIPALLIEQALPDIESHANEILERLSSGQMAIKFETQKKYSDKKRADLMETLDIIISDGSGDREYELFSGGEAFRINFAIRLALSRVLARRSGARLQTLVIDEGFGSQDAEGRQRLIEAINLVRSDFEKILVITHLEELKDAFTARIEVTKEPKGSRIQVVAA